MSQWQDDGIHVAWKSNLKRIQDSTKEEILYANRELLSIRRRELESLLASDKEKYERELSQKGLAFNKNRIWELFSSLSWKPLYFFWKK